MVKVKDKLNKFVVGVKLSEVHYSKLNSICYSNLYFYCDLIIFISKYHIITLKTSLVDLQKNCLGKKKI